MNDWYNTNEHRSYPFKENNDEKSIKKLPYKEIVDCRFFLKNAKSNFVYLKSREDNGNSITYTFGTSDETLNPAFTVEKSAEFKVVRAEEDRWYGFCVFGDTTSVLEDDEEA